MVSLPHRVRLYVPLRRDLAEDYARRISAVAGGAHLEEGEGFYLTDAPEETYTVTAFCSHLAKVCACAKAIALEYKDLCHQQAVALEVDGCMHLL